MLYYRVPQELDGKQIYVNNSYVSLAGNELFTKRECEKLGLTTHHVFSKFTLVKVKKIYTFFGARFELNSERGTVSLNGTVLTK